MKRIFLFVMTNLAIVVVLGIVANVLGVNRFLTANGLDLTALLGFALLMGFGGVIALGCTIGQGITGVSTLAETRWPFTL